MNLFQQVSERFPKIRYMGLGLWLAWTYLAFDSGIWVDVTEIDSSAPSNVFMASTLGYVASCVVFARAPAKIAALFEQKRAFLALGTAGSLLCVVLYLCGPNYLMALSLPMATVLSLLAAFLTGAITSAISARCMQLFAPLSAKEIWLLAAGNLLLSGAVYFIVIGNPHSFRIAMFCLLPLVAALLVMDNPDQSESGPQACPARRTAFDLRSSKLIARFVIAIALMTLATGVVRSEVSYYMDPMAAQTYSNIAVTIRLAIACVAIVCILRLPETFKLSKLFYGALLLVAFAPSIVAMFSLNSALIYCTLSGLYTLFTLFVWCLLAQLGARSAKDVIAMYAKGWGGLTLGGLVGSFIGLFVPLLQLESDTMLVIGFAVLLICILTSMFVLTDRDFDRLVSECIPSEEGVGALREPDSGLPHQNAKSALTFDEAVQMYAEAHLLSRREKDVVSAMLQGEKPNAIAEKLYLSINTVRRHVQNIYTKIDSHTREDLYETFYMETGYSPFSRD